MNLDDDVLFDTLDDLLQRRIITERKSGIDEFLPFEDENMVLSYMKQCNLLCESKCTKPRRTPRNRYIFTQHQGYSTLSHHFRCGQVSGKAYQHLSLAALRLWERGLLQSAMENVEHAHPLTKLAKQELSEDNSLNRDYSYCKCALTCREIKENGRKP